MIYAILSGPSASGKSSLIRYLQEAFPQKIGLAVSYTTRVPRAGEMQSAHYHFVSEQKFLQLLCDGHIVEYVYKDGYYYGSSFAELKNNAHQITIFDVDISGAIAIQEYAYRNSIKVTSIFITVSDLQELERRLRSRTSEPGNYISETEIQSRLKRAEEEMKNVNNFNYIVINDTYSVACQQLCEIFQPLLTLQSDN